ncbi:DUF5991 domain-containing protein [Cellulophaga sp. Z1A5H]|uniref:DUF5991 domain-containing protein n=1 Tax=Cellulophaga sp. Z1A5H TaxID=2687291 RepID=UPI0013FD5ECE|nr:DUF5991 domain-containing protein [Cellulophaga sp. Z1A5H]
MKKLAKIIVLLIIVISCKEKKKITASDFHINKEVEKNVVNLERKDNVIFLDEKDKVWYQFDNLPYAICSNNNEYYYSVAFIAKNEEQYNSLNSLLIENDLSSSKIGNKLKTRNNFHMVAFLTMKKDIGMAEESGEVNYYKQYPSNSKIYLFNEEKNSWIFIKDVMCESFSEEENKKTLLIYEIIGNNLQDKLLNEKKNQNTSKWSGTYSWEYNEGRNVAGDYTGSYYELKISEDSTSFTGMGYQTEFKYLCLNSAKKDTLYIYKYKDLVTNKNEIDIFPLIMYKKGDKMFLNSEEIKLKEE